MNQDYDTRVALLEKENEEISDYFEKINTAMEKLTEISFSIKEMMTVQEMRIDELIKDLKIIEAEHDSVKKEIGSVQHEILKLTGNFTKDVEQSKMLIYGISVVVIFILYKLKVIPFLLPG